MVNSSAQASGAAPSGVTATSLSSDRNKVIRIAVIVGCIAVAAIVSWGVYLYTWYHPTTASGSIEANVVHVSSVVGGRMVELPIAVNQHVNKGDLLYKIQREPYEIAVAKAEGAYNFARASLQQVERDIRSQQARVQESTASQAEVLQKRDYALRRVKRLAPLAAKTYISKQEFDEAKTQLAEAEAALVRSQGSTQSALSSVTTLDMSKAKVEQAKSELDLARWKLDQTTVYATVSGYITSLEVKEGEVLDAGHPLFTLVADSNWYAIANIREVNLRPVHEGECVTVYSMINRQQPMRGVVESIGHGVSNENIHYAPNHLPGLQRTMDWVHISQRFPVRVRIEDGEPDLLRMGATAIIQIGRGAACRSSFKAHSK